MRKSPKSVLPCHLHLDLPIQTLIWIAWLRTFIDLLKAAGLGFLVGVCDSVGRRTYIVRYHCSCVMDDQKYLWKIATISTDLRLFLTFVMIPRSLGVALIDYGHFIRAKTHCIRFEILRCLNLLHSIINGSACTGNKHRSLLINLCRHLNLHF